MEIENLLKVPYVNVEETPSRNINLHYNFPISYMFGKKNSYINYPIAFDIETTSDYVKDAKVAYMYIWQCAIYEDVYIGRTWDSFVEFINELCQQNGVSPHRKLVIYVHNLSFEFQFIKKLFDWDTKGQLMIESRKPCRVTTTGGVEFRCSYLLSNAPLSQLNTKKWKKAVGDLDYDLKRNYKTPLTPEEIGYCINDVLVVTEYIQNEIEHYGNIIKIPKTSTGAVRNYCKDKCIINNPLYKDTMAQLTLEPEEYNMLKFGFQGGFTHASAIHSGVTMDDVTSYDFTSSYPAVMCAEKFPMSKGRMFGVISLKRYEEMKEVFCVLAKVVIKGLMEKLVFEHPLSKSKCFDYGGMIEDNGRVVKADYLTTILTELDYDTLKQFYEWDEIKIFGGYYYRKEYLPKAFILCILDFYQGKTTLKGIDEKEDEYMRKKAMLNSCYGMCVTDIVKPTNVYDNEQGWLQKDADLKTSLASYNSSKMRFLFYPWGVWVTAYARHNLFTGIKECGYDYIYADTDSVKIRNPEAHSDYFEQYNTEIVNKIRKMAEHYNIPLDLIEPKTIKGVPKPLGVWDYDGHYKKFRTLGAKRYLTIADDESIHLTVSGVKKSAGQNFLVEKYGDVYNAIEHFAEGIIFPPEGTGKMTHTYIDDTAEFDTVDYLGNKAHIVTLSGTHLEGASYELSLSQQYKDFLYTLLLDKRWV